MAESVRMDLTSLDTYRSSCLDIAQKRLGGFADIESIAAAEEDLNAYENLGRLTEPRDIVILDVENTPIDDLDRAKRAVLDGRIFWEHAAAGEATRLKMGTKYLIFPPHDLTPINKIAHMMTDDFGREVTPDEVRQKLDVEPADLLPMTLGERHMLQLAFDVRRLAEETGDDPDRVLARQKVLIVLNEKTADEIVSSAFEDGFMGFSPENCLFMVQPAFPGIDVRGGRFVFDPDSPKRLHNHGQLVMQETSDGQIFRIDESGRRVYLGSSEFGAILEDMADKISYNIEDLDYLTGSIDWPHLALALKLGAEGFNMIMEIVANDPDRPIKGGMAAYDEVWGRNVMIESFQLKGLPNEAIRFLNKNFNHYTNPSVSWRAVRETGLPMPVVVKSGRLYFQPVQGDINFLVRTAFVRRKIIKPIRAWKSASNTIDAVNAMHAQDRQPGFETFAQNTLGRTF